jgi:UrcA family protein
MKTLLAAAALALAAPVAMAEVVIRYSPDGTRVHTRPIILDPIHTQDDAARAYVQLERASKRVCAHYGQSIQVFQKHAAARACQAEALEQAVASLGDARVTAIHGGAR